MGWLRRWWRPPAAPEPAAPATIERHTPAVAALFAGLREDRSHAVLDLGPAADASLRVYGRFARHVRFADLPGEAAARGWAAAIAGLPAHPAAPYDLVLAWDVLDRMGPEERPRLVKRLTELSASDARLHIVMDAPEKRTWQPLRFTLLDVDRLRYQAAAPPGASPPRLLPAELERLVAPFRVVRAFTVGGMREYLAIRPGGRP